jgi:hypothetical protein
MKKFNQARITLFDSTIASFKLSIEANFTRARQDGSVANLAYITDKGTAVLNPSIYLVFSFKGDTYETTKNLYTSYPQLFEVRSALSQVKDLLVGKKGFVNIENILTVRPEFQSPVVIENIGKQNKWMSFTLVAIDSTEQGLAPKIPGVSVQLSDSEYVSVLTAEELLTIYSIVMNVDLTTYMLQLTHMFLEGDDQAAGQYAAPQPVYQQQPAYQQPYQQAPQQQYQQRQPQQQYGRAPLQRTQPATAPRQTQQTYNNTAPVQPAATGSGLPPRQENKQIVNMKAVEETPVSSFSLDDEDAINSIFNDNE